MRGAAIHLTSAVSGFVVLLLSLPVMQGHNDWAVTYPSTEICAIKGSTVDIPCTYTYPSRVENKAVEVQKTWWFTGKRPNKPVDPKTHSGSTSHVEFNVQENDCTLTIKDLRESDSAVYKFAFQTNQKTFSTSSGVSLSVTGLQVKVQRSSSFRELQCHSSCNLAGSSYVWFKNRQKMKEKTKHVKLSVKDSDSFSCAVKGREDDRSPQVYPPKFPSVSVRPSAEIVEGSSVTLTCSSDANPAANYTWYKENGSTLRKSVFEFQSIQSSHSGRYYCSAENNLGRRTSEYIYIDVKYPPKFPSVSVSPSAEIVEGSSVTLTCSSDANPAAKYTWYKDNGSTLKKSVFEFQSIQSSHSGRYYCSAENNLGRRTSEYIYIDVKYAPKIPSVSVSPSAEIVEGISVTLTCSSDANPAAKYTWYKEKDLTPLSKHTSLFFRSIQSSDSGGYYCTAENKQGRGTSDYIYINVKYPPKPPSVSVSPSAEIVEGSSVTLTCSSDANPAANYTWYKENEDSPKASGQIFTITNIRPEHSGNYYCEAQNTRGRQNSTLYLTVVAGTRRIMAVLMVTVLVLALTLIPVFVCIINKSFSRLRSEPGERGDNREQLGPAVQEDDLYYDSVQFSKHQTEAVYSNFTSSRPQGNTKEVKEGGGTVEYAAVTFNRADPRTRSQEPAEDLTALYSTVNKARNKQ